MKSRFLWIGCIIVLLLTLVSATHASPPSGPVTIVTEIDFSSFPFHGTFHVTEGTTILGCESGTFIDIPFTLGPSAIRKIFTCDVGANDGTFTVIFRPNSSAGPGDVNSHWVILEGTDDFAVLRGEGNFSVNYDPMNPSAIETLTGYVHFEE